MELANKKIGILGFGEENQALAKYLIEIGIKNITICDEKREEEIEAFSNFKNDIQEWRLGPDYLNSLEDFDIIFRTPGIPYLDPKIQNAIKNGTEASSEIKLFFKLCPSPIIGVTGTKGKGTTSTLIHNILNEDGKRVFLGGNIGRPPIGFLNELTKEDLVVLELSSFLLQDLGQSPHIAVVLNITSDHMDIHKSNEEYVQAKSNIIKYQNSEDYCVLNADYPSSAKMGRLTKAKKYWFSRTNEVDQGVWVKDKKWFMWRENGLDIEICQTADLKLRGQHNWENISAAATASLLAGAKVDQVGQIIKNFKGLEHRLELVKTINRVSFYNDSFSTNPDTAIAAIDSFTEPLILIAGGSSKGADFTQMGKIIAANNVKAVVLIGTEAQKIKASLEHSGYKRKIIIAGFDFKKAILLAKTEAHEGDAVLLSPACASFDMFKNYKDRGLQFKAQI